MKDLDPRPLAYPLTSALGAPPDDFNDKETELFEQIVNAAGYRFTAEDRNALIEYCRLEIIIRHHLKFFSDNPNAMFDGEKTAPRLAAMKTLLVSKTHLQEQLGLTPKARATIYKNTADAKTQLANLENTDAKVKELLERKKTR